MNPEKVPQMIFPIGEIEASAATQAGSFSEGVVEKTENSLLSQYTRQQEARHQGGRREEGGGRLSFCCHISLHAGLPVLGFPALASSVAAQREPGFGPAGGLGHRENYVLY